MPHPGERPCRTATYKRPDATAASLNARLGRIAAVAQGARPEGWQQRLPLAISAVLVRAAGLATRAARLDPARRGQQPRRRRRRPRPPRPAPWRRPWTSAASSTPTCSARPMPRRPARPTRIRSRRPRCRWCWSAPSPTPTRRSGYAIIGENAAAAKVYSVGKTITGGTKLHSVYPDRAILDRGGKLEALLLPKKFRVAA